MLIKKNPVLTGFHPDPCILRVENDYYLATSTFQWFGGVELYHSRDLVNWEQLPCPLRRTSQLDMQGNPNSGGVWAPCLSYSDGVFYLIYTNVKNFHGIFKDTHNYLVTATDPRGEWSEPIYLNSSGFDPSLFHDDDGKKYLLNMRWDHRMEKHDFAGILMQEYDPKAKKLVGEIKTIYRGTEIGATEAPHLYKKNGYYYLMVAEGGTMYNHGVRLARSKNVWGEYESDPCPILTTRNNPEKYMQRTGHASYVETPEGQGYVAYLSARPIRTKKVPTGELGYSILGRETCLAPVKWENGWLRLENGGVVPPEEYYSNLCEVKYPKENERDVFEGDLLPLKYKTLRLPFDRIGSLTERKGYLRIYGKEAITSPSEQSMVARRLDAFCATATCELEFEPKTFQQMAGLTVFYDTYNFFYLYMSRDEESDENCLRIIVRDSLKFYNPIPEYRVLIGQNKRVWLRAEINELSLKFYYSLNGEEYIEIGGVLDCSNLSDEAYVAIGHEGHTGTFIGMAVEDLTGKKAYADFKSFEYKGK
ncbi:MAG: glycoside hydrolase family 43 protein [Clostridia bacterium]|nr:glycoside hydrolase family 43 protein [Clostridia bacterium]